MKGTRGTHTRDHAMTEGLDVRRLGRPPARLAPPHQQPAAERQRLLTELLDELSSHTPADVIRSMRRLAVGAAEPRPPARADGAAGRGSVPMRTLAESLDVSPGERDRHRRPHGAARPRRAASATTRTGASSGSRSPTTAASRSPASPPSGASSLAKLLERADRRRARGLPPRHAGVARGARRGVGATTGPPRSRRGLAMIDLFRSYLPPYRWPLVLVLVLLLDPGDREPVPARAQRRHHQQRRRQGRHRLHPAHGRLHARS